MGQKKVSSLEAEMHARVVSTWGVLLREVSSFQRLNARVVLGVHDNT